MALTVDALHPAYERVAPQRERLRLTYSGTDAVKGAGTAILPMLGAATDPNAAAQYQAYQQRAYFLGAMPRTVEGISGLVFRNPPTTTLPMRSQAAAYMEDVTLTGLPLDRFAQQLYREVLTLGFAGVYVTLPQAPTPRARAYLTLYRAEDVINWRHSFDGESYKLARVVLREQIYEEDSEDRFLLKEIEIYRELALDENGLLVVNVFREARQGSTEEKFVQVDQIEPRFRGQRLDYIPFTPCSPEANDFTVDRLPLLPLADANLDHYRLMADYRHGLHWVGLPTPWTQGVDDTSALTIGPARAWNLPQGASAEMLEFTGQGLRPLETAIEQQVEAMAGLGAKLLQQEKRAAEAAETHRIRQSREEAAAVSVAEAVSAALSRAVTQMLTLSGIPGDAAVELNRDLVDAKLRPEEIRELVSAWVAGAYTWETLAHNLTRGEVMRPDVPVEDEKALLATQGVAPPQMLELPDEE